MDLTMYGDGEVRVGRFEIRSVSWRHTGGMDHRIVVRTYPRRGLLRRLLGWPAPGGWVERTFYGSCTVYHTESGMRASRECAALGIPGEWILSGLMHRACWLAGRDWSGAILPAGVRLTS